MEQVIDLANTIRAHPALAGGIALGVGALVALLRRRPKIQREADARLAALRRDKADQYTTLRPPR